MPRFSTRPSASPRSRGRPPFSLLKGLVSFNRRPVGRICYRKGLRYSFFKESTLNLFSPTPSLSDEQRKDGGIAEGGLRSSSETGYRSGFKRHTRLLQPSVRCSQEKRQASANHRPVLLEPLHYVRPVQDGDDKINKRGHSTTRMGRLYRSEGRVSTRPHSSVVSKVSPLPIRRENLRISRATLRDKHRSLSLHQINGSRCGSHSKGGISLPPVLRRLAASSAKQTVSFEQPVRRLAPHTGSGSHPKSGEVGFGSDPILHLRGDVLSHGPRARVGSPSKGGSADHHSQGSTFQKAVICESFPLTSGRLGGSGGPCSFRPPAYEANSTVSSQSLAPVEGFSGVPHSDSRSGSSPPHLVARPEHSVLGGPYFSPNSGHNLTDRCFVRGLGRTPGTARSHDQRSMVANPEAGTHQQPRTEGCFSCSATLSSTCEKSLCDDCFRQFHCSGVYKEAGRDSFSVPLLLNQGHAPLVPESGNKAHGKTHPRSTKSPSGLFVKGGERNSHGVESEPIGCSELHTHMGSPCGRSIRLQAEPQTSPLRVSSSRQSSLGSRCSESRPERSRCVRISSVQSDPNHSEQGSFCQLPPDSDRPLLASEIMVQPTAVSLSGAPQGSSTDRQPSQPARRERPASKRALPPPSRVETVKRSLSKKGFSSKAAGLIAQARRPSTSTVYDAKWRIFSNWCVQRKIDPLHPSVARVADFFVYLFQDRKCSPSTIKGYRSAISSALKFSSCRAKDVGSDVRISELIKHFDRARPVSRTVVPKWNLSCVLWSLTKAPYEPMSSASLLNCSVKTCFLLALASAKRRSELHAMCIDEGYLRFGNNGVSLTLEPGFLAKTQLPSKRPDPIFIPSLDQVCGPLDDDRLLCPVRALRFYLQKSKPLRLGRKRLFIPSKGKGDISPSTISRWIRMAILKAYGDLTERNLTFLQIRAHEVRAVATSWAFQNRVPMEDILHAATWLNHSTFSNFYLRSLTAQEDGLFRLGPLVTAQKIISK